MIRALSCLLPAAVFAVALAGQEKLEVGQPEPAILRLGDSARAVIRIEGRAANPKTPELPEVEGLQMVLSPPTRSSYMSFDGRKRTSRVGVQYVLELRPLRQGTFKVPPFRIFTGTRHQETPELRLEAKQDLLGAELGFLSVTVEPLRVYVHEPVRVRVDYGVRQGVHLVQDMADRYRYLDIEIKAGWLDDFPGGETLDSADASGDTRLVVRNQKLIRAGYEGGFERDGKAWQKFSFDRAFLPTQLGKIELAAPMLRINQLRRSGRTDLFSRGRGQTSENFYVYGKPVTLEVLPIPSEGRPSPYFGAVGRFTIEASLDRDRVRVSESLKLALTVRGQGNFEFLRMPELQDLEGFHKLGTAETQRDQDRVVVTYDLTPLSPDVKEISAISWNYFDTTPGVEKFVEVKTAPLALVVEAIVDGVGMAPLPREAALAVTPGVDDIFDLPDFEGPAVTVTPTPSWLTWLAVLLPWVFMWGAFVAHRARQRAMADLTGKRVRGAKRQFELALQRGDDVLDAVAAYLGDRLDVEPAAVISPELAERLRTCGLDGVVADEVAALMERGSEARYGGGVAFPADEAWGLVQRLETVRFGARCLLPFLLLPVLALSCGDLCGQEKEAIRSYRDGDYAAADASFGRAYESDPDRRYLRARGNCLFRMGDLARARWAFESARIGLPRDQELLANLRVVRQRLQLPEVDEGFGMEVRRLLDQWTLKERMIAGLICMLFAAGFLVFGWHRVSRRWLGAIWLVPGMVLALDVVWLTPNREVQGVALRELAMTAEPRAGMQAVATIREGVVVDLLGKSGGDFLRIEASGRSGYVAADAVWRIE